MSIITINKIRILEERNVIANYGEKIENKSCSFFIFFIVLRKKIFFPN